MRNKGSQRLVEACKGPVVTKSAVSNDKIFNYHRLNPSLHMEHETSAGAYMQSPVNQITQRSSQQNKNSLYLLYNLISKEFKLKYRRSILGVAWSILNPLLMMIVMALIFTNIFRFEFNMYPYAIYLILGQTLFTVFQDGSNGSLQSIIDYAPLIKKVRVAKIIFPTEKVLFAVVNFFFSLIAVVGVMAFFQMVPSWMVVLTPVLLILLTLFTLGVGYIVATLAVFFRDMIHLWGVLMTVWFYFTPIFWPYEALANGKISWVMSLIQFNPMFHFVACFRQMVTGVSLSSDIGVFAELGLCAIFAVVTFIIGLMIFKKFEKRFILYV